MSNSVSSDYAGATPNNSTFHGRSFRPVMQEPNRPGWDETYASHTFHEITMYYPMRVIRGRRYKLIWNLASGLSFPFATDLYASETWQGIVRSGNPIYGKRSVDAYLHRSVFELYDLESDSHEVNNLAEIPEYREILVSLQDRLRAYQKDTQDPWIAKWEHE